MKKKLILGILVIGALILSSLAYGYTLDLFQQTKYSTFQIGMTIKRAESLLSDYELTSRTESKTVLGDSTILSFDNGELEETLTLYFTNGKMSGFLYTNWQVK